MVLVDAHPVKAHPVGELQLVQVVGVVLTAQLRVKVFVGQVHPGAMVPGLKVLGEMLVGHQVEEGDFHNVHPRLCLGPMFGE